MHRLLGAGIQGRRRTAGPGPEAVGGLDRGAALAGVTLPEGDEIAERWPGANLGGMVLAIHVASLLPGEAFSAEVDRYVRAIRENFSPLPGYDEVLLPGHVEERIMDRHRREGIRFGEPEQRAALDLSRYLDVPLPW